MKKRLLALLTVLCMLLSMLPATAFAKTVEPLEPVYISQYNPLYGEPDEGITLEQYAPVTLADHAFEGQVYPDDREQVVATLRAGLEARQNTITFNYFLDGDTYDGSKEAGKAMLSGLFASALEHTGEPTEGDYIRWVYEQMSAGSNGYNYGGDYYLTITFTMTYYTTAAQEQAVTDRLATVMPSFGFTAETDDYTKVKTIYDYICDNVVYDNANLKDDSYKLKYTAYAALINGTSVCQGYAVLLYRMLLMAGVDNRVITGISNGGNHAWNIVQLGEYYYDADSTWDAGETEYDYFLRCPANFDPTHTRHDEYNTAAFNTAYPMASADYDPYTAGGKCGDNAYWSLTNGTLSITGSGDMYNYANGAAPWYAYASAITKIIVGDEITKIGTYAFSGCTALDKITFLGNMPTIFEDFCFLNVTATAYYPCNNDTWTDTAVADLAAAHTSVTWKANHSEKVIPGAPNSCFSSGYTDSVKCSVCGETLVAREWLPAQHHFTDGYCTVCSMPEGLVYTTSGGYLTITDYTGSLSELTIPATLNNKRVNEIQNTAFEDCTSLVKVTLPDTISTIDFAAFSDCTNLQQINIPASVREIKSMTFYNCRSLTSIVIPENITKIAWSAFENCTSLSSVTLPSTITEIGNSAFDGCTASKKVYLSDIASFINSTADDYFSSPFSCSKGNELYLNGTLVTDLTLPGEVTTIGVRTFYGCDSLTSITISEGTTNIEEAAFQFCNNVTSITLPKSIEYIGNFAFNATRPGISIYLADLASYINSTAQTSSSATPFSSSTDNKLYLNGALITDLVIPDGVTTVGVSAFAGCDFNSVTIPASVTTIKGNAFNRCTVSGSITFTGDILTVKAGAFSSTTATALYPCDNDTWTDTAVADLAAAHTSVTWTAAHDPKTVSGTANSCFTGGISDGVQCTICEEWLTPQTTVPAGHTFENGYCTVCGLPQGLQYRLTVIGEEVCNDKLTIIGYTGTLTELTVPETINGKTVTAIGDGTFMSHTTLKKVTLPDTITEIGYNGFAYCRPLESINIPSGVTAIKGHTFEGCNQLTEITLPAGLISVETYAFADCAGLTEVTIPNKVTSIGSKAFAYCDNLRSITFTGDLPAVDAYAFHETTATALYPCDNDTWTDTAVADLAAAHTSVTWKAAHDPKTVSGTANSCFTGGISDGVQCTICEEWLTPQTPIEAGHKNENGYCTVCGLPEGLTYTVYGDKVTVTGYTGTLTELTVPETINGKTVTALDGGGAFQYNTTLKKVTLPDTLTAFGGYTFNGCSALESVNIPAGVKSIGGYSFANCTSLKNITIPEGVAEIGVHAFYQSGLTSITVPNSVTSLLGGAFSYCKSLTDVTLGSGLTVLPLSLFSGCSALKTLTIPANVTTIGDEAFQHCTALERITIPNKVTDIGDRAFYNCAALTKITLNGDLPIFGTSCFVSTTATVLYPCDNDTWTDTMVDNLASAHPSVTWTAAHDPKTVSGTPNSCFTGGISDGVQCTICEKWLTPQTPVPAGHKLIVDGHCTVCGLPEGLLYTVNGDSVTVTDYTGSLTELTIPATINGKTVTAIDNYAFDGCVRLKRITLPDSVTDIGKFAFMSCTALENVNIPAGVNAIRNGTFSGCSALKTVSLGAHIGSIGDYAFDGCTGLERINIPSGVTTIGMYAFESCAALERITIPEDVIDIGKYAFYRCGSLDTVRFLGNAPTIGSGCFSGVTADAYYPCGDTWTENKLQSYGGSISWTVEHNYVGGVCTGCGAAEPSVEGVTRLAGSNRFDTAFKSADALKEVMGVDKFPAAIVTSGMNFADALAGSYLAYVKDAPILLTNNYNIGDVMAYIRENVEDGGTVYALGGAAVVTDELMAIERDGFVFKRLAGASRFETNLEILKECGDMAGEDILVCTAFNFADSLSASAAKRPILLVGDTLTAAQKEFLAEMDGSDYYLVGGTGAVTAAVENELRQLGDVTRLAGNNRYHTSVMVAETFFDAPTAAVLAYALNFPDGLCGGPLAAAIDAPLILTATGSEGPATVYANSVGITDGFVLGGPSLISDGVAYRVFSMGAGEDIRLG